MEEKYESLITGIIEQGYGLVDDFLPASFVADIRAYLLAQKAESKFRPAGIGQQATQHTTIRNDQILWIEPDSPQTLEAQYQEALMGFLHYLNRSCYTGLRTAEMHYAFYDTGSFYKMHVDRFQHDSRRQFSAIFYLNENWNDTDGGELLLQLANGREMKIAPQAGRLVCFRSHELPHAVLPAKRPRLSITSWMLK
ncbi:2OG-Fe(II) oxygenase [Saprospira sp. CCB-QB6]|uniref:2OG-Fe(II) oxygenase n=1 Tax=Saprospira sp. CCB-QB6 TaxID=3023936 RepID=UPI00234A517F|nr:2OG-Fe(II) oxygenase [Saprospira sp. CCB-QB6]WCL81739.1 2OG-Fe(II) oxygenase [Saprospira sp. CCB-QB6]